MKKIILSMMALLAAAGSYAQDKIYFDDVEIPQGGSANLAVNLESKERLYGGLQCDFTLPEGVTASAITKTDRISDAFTLQIGKQGEGYRILIYNSSGQEITGEDGPIAYVTVSAESSVAMGEYDAALSGITISTISKQEYTSDDSNFKVTIGDTWILDENSMALPAKSTKAVNVKVKRTIAANQWNTICLPFDMDEDQLKEAFGDDVKIAEFKSFTTEKDEEDAVKAITITFANVDLSEDDLYSNTPYIIYTSKDVSEFSLKTKIDPDESSASAKSKKSYFYGTLHAGVTIPKNSLFISNNKFWYSAGKTKIKAFRGYFTMQDILASVADAGAKISLSVDGDVTAIDDAFIAPRVAEGVYDLSGRKIKVENGDVNTLQKGVYIIDGKKVTIK